jgi:hypothetical protein
MRKLILLTNYYGFSDQIGRTKTHLLKHDMTVDPKSFQFQNVNFRLLKVKVYHEKLRKKYFLNIIWLKPL